MKYLRLVERETKTWALVTPTGDDYKTGFKLIEDAVKYAKQEGFLPYRVDKHGEIEQFAKDKDLVPIETIYADHDASVMLARY